MEPIATNTTCSGYCDANLYYKIIKYINMYYWKNKKMYYMTEPNGHLRYFISQSSFVLINLAIVVVIHAVEIT